MLFWGIAPLEKTALSQNTSRDVQQEALADALALAVMPCDPAVIRFAARQFCNGHEAGTSSINGFVV